MKTNSNTINIYTLQDPTWLKAVRLNKGIGHDRQALGVILESGTRIRINHQGTPDTFLGLELFNDDRLTEETHYFNDNPSEYTINHTSVPFISTPYTMLPASTNILVEYEPPPSPLPIFRSDSDADTFFKQWDNLSSAFALLNFEYCDILVPAKDKTHLKELHQRSGLKSLEDFYNSVFITVNSLAGLSFSPNEPTDKNIPNRYFMKADKHGYGSAYYSSRYTAETNDSTATFWLTPLAQNWGAIHEIAHGYEGYFTEYNSTIPLGEVWNNIYAHLYQEQHLGDKIFDLGWMYSGDPELLHDSMELLFESNPSISTWQAHQKLFYLILIFHKTGNIGFTTFNKAYRKLASTSDYYWYENYSFIDLLSSICAEATYVDLSSFLQITHTTPSRIQDLICRYRNHKPVTPLYKIIPRDKIESILKQLNLISRLDLVDTIALNKTNLTGTIELLLSDELFDAYSNKDFLLKHGSNLTKIINISTQKITINNIPIGLYTLQPASTKNSKLYILTKYIEVKPDTTNSINIEYEPLSGLKLASREILLNGIHGAFASLTIDLGSNSTTININSVTPNAFQNILYASFTIRNTDQHIIFQKDIHSQNTIPSINKIGIGLGYTIEIFHHESSRPKLIIPLSKNLLSMMPTNILTVTPQGLCNVETGTSTSENLKITIDYVANVLRSEPHSLLNKSHPLKDEIFAAIDSFPEDERNQLLGQYKDIYLTHQNTEPKIVTGTSFSWHQSSPNGEIVKIEITPQTETLHIEVLEGIPDRLCSTMYLAIWVYNNKGNILFCQEIYGKVTTEHTLVNLPFKEGFEICVFHLEPTRSPIINMDTNEQHQVMQRHSVRALTSNRLEI